MGRAVYQKLENLTMNKLGEVIDLECPLNGNIGIDAQIYTNSPNGNRGDYYAFGARDVESGNKFMGASQLYRNGTYQTTFFYGTFATYWSYATPVSFYTYKIVVPASGSVQCVGSSTRTTAKQSFSYPNHNIYVFGVHVKDGDKDYVEYNNTGYIRYLKLTNNGKLIRDMVPVKRLSDGICGLFDIVSKKFFITKSGNTSCLSGTVVANTYYDSQGNQINSLESLNEKLENIEETKGLIKEAIVSKGIEVSDTDSFRSYAEKINNIKSGSSGAKITDASYLFYGGARLDNKDELLQLCENITSTLYMFCNCDHLTELDVSMLDTSNVIDMAYMFRDCDGLTELDVSNFNTSNVTSMRDMFWGCSFLTELDLSNFNTSNVTSMNTMFSSCQRLKSLNVKSFNTSNVIYMDTMFASCSSLTELDISNFDFSKTIKIDKFVYSCFDLKDLQFGTNLGKGYTQKSTNYSYYTLDLSKSTNLTHDSLMSVINKLYDLNLTYDVANGGTLYTQQLIIGADNLAKLTADEIAIATNKGWTVS